MKIKRLIAILAVLCMLPVQAFAASNTAAVDSIDFVETDLAKSIVTISGTLASGASEQLTIMVAKDGIDLDAPGITNDDIRYFNATTESNADGSFSFIFPITVNDSLVGYGDTGEYKYSISAMSVAGAPITGTFYGASEARKSAILAGIDQEAVATLETNLDVYARALGIDTNKAYSNANAANIVDLITPAGFTTTRGFMNGGNLAEELNAAEDKIIEAAITDCYNNSIEAGIAEGTKLLYADKIGIDGSDAYNLYNSTLNVGTVAAPNLIGLTTEGKNTVLDAMQGKNLAGYEDLKKEFIEATVLTGITKTSAGGTSHISYLLTSANAAVIGDADLTTAITYYLNNADVRGAVNQKIFDAAPATVAGLATAINNAVDAAIAEKPVSGGNGGGVGGGVTGPVASGGAESGAGNGGNGGNGTFIDVPFDHWANADITALYNLRVVNGYPGNIFMPNGIIKREEGLKMICEAFDMYGTGIAIDFSDVPVGAWFENYVKIGVENGITTGLGGNLFGTGRSISRQDLAVMIYRLAGSPEVNGSFTYADGASIATYAADAINFMVSRGIMSGYPDGTIRPTKAITRAEAAKIINGCIKEGI